MHYGAIFQQGSWNLVGISLHYSVHAFSKEDHCLTAVVGQVWLSSPYLDLKWGNWKDISKCKQQGEKKRKETKITPNGCCVTYGYKCTALYFQSRHWYSKRSTLSLHVIHSQGKSSSTRTSVRSSLHQTVWHIKSTGVTDILFSSRSHVMNIYRTFWKSAC